MKRIGFAILGVAASVLFFLSIHWHESLHYDLPEWATLERVIDNGAAAKPDKKRSVSFGVFLSAITVHCLLMSVAIVSFAKASDNL